MNLAQFKKRLIDTLKNGGTVDFHYKDVTTYGINHPMRALYPEGRVQERSETGCKIGRVQSNSFTRLTHGRQESWLDFGKASDWQFPDNDTAINVGAGYTGADHKCTVTITYRFNSQ
jgi:hypothetical protein